MKLCEKSGVKTEPNFTKTKQVRRNSQYKDNFS